MNQSNCTIEIQLNLIGSMLWSSLFEVKEFFHSLIFILVFMQTPVENPVTATGAAHAPTSTVPQKATPSTAVTNVFISNDAKRKLDQVSASEEKGTNVVQQNTGTNVTESMVKVSFDILS